MNDLPVPNNPFSAAESASNEKSAAMSSQDRPAEGAEKAVKQKKAARPAAKVDLANLPDLLTISEVSGLLRVSPLTIKRWGKRGKLPAIRINSRGDRRYKKQAVLWMLGMTETETA
ncbi:MAG TPA: MerR family transcriptional regulator [Candidatus Saccharimonadia bacterium]|nr:MerR family transcriptional regulator [Candidatus Saccharimonadia bacterium]